MKKMTQEKILVTGCAGFIGMHLCKTLLDEGFSVLGIDNLNNYYDTNLKLKRLDHLINIKKTVVFMCHCFLFLYYEKI